MPPPDRKPWPMRWIVLCIAAFVVLYTWVNLRYRKTAPAFEPYAESVARQRASAAGYARITAELQLPADGAARDSAAVPAAPAPGGLPAGLLSALADRPILATEVGSVAAPAAVEHARPYVIEFRATAPSDREQLAGAEVYVGKGEIVIVPACERLVAGLTARSRTTAVRLVVPPDKLPPGAYRALLVGEQASAAWPLQVH